jgi:hypothetical protein
MEPLRPIDVRLGRGVDRVTPPVRLSPVERDAERERREQARKRRQSEQESPPDGGDSDGGHLDLLA